MRSSGPLEGGFAVGRQVAVDLIHIQDGAERTRTGLRAHPGLDGRQQQGEEEHALAVAQVGEIEDAVARPAIFGEQQRWDIEGLALRARLRKAGAARILLSCIASAERSLAGKKVSTGKAPSLSNGGDWICRIRSVSSRSLP